MPESPLSRWIRLIRPQDFVWIPLFIALAVTSENLDIFVVVPLVALGFVQVLEPKIKALSDTRWRVVWIILKMAIIYLLIAYTDGIQSNFWLLLLLPVVSAATVSGLLGTLVFTTLAGLAYLSFLLFLDWEKFVLERPEIELLIQRVVCLFLVGNLANLLAEALRQQNQKYRRTAEHLEDANRQVVEAQEAVRRSDRLAALGQLTAGLAHELRNPLGTIKASAEMLNQQLSTENEVAREVAGFISTEVDRTNSLVTRFLQFARPLHLRLEHEEDLAHVLDRAIELAEREAPGIAIYRNYAPEIPPFRFDGELMERVFYNLVLNAAQATASGGAVTVKTRATGRRAEIAVIDRGSGIDAKAMKDIFNPFFTTKKEGVGLGLAIVSKIVDEHGGKIAVESESGKGSIFCVSLPMDPAPQPPL
ncbi:MAG: signal transduction histidine kinase, nitrogen specific, NtrB [Candidatus Solibacter sp.]|nr:signal transduction histidine kinase, nitrogen specific, NtrB [Candidatus Solibacter sp.]